VNNKHDFLLFNVIIFKLVIETYLFCFFSTAIFSNTKSVFDSVVAGAFQIVFRVEMHANDVFLFFKNHF
jgi:hypothetical protein